MPLLQDDLMKLLSTWQGLTPDSAMQGNQHLMYYSVHRKLTKSGLHSVVALALTWGLFKVDLIRHCSSWCCQVKVHLTILHVNGKSQSITAQSALLVIELVAN